MWLLIGQCWETFEFSETSEFGGKLIWGANLLGPHSSLWVLFGRGGFWPLGTGCWPARILCKQKPSFAARGTMWVGLHRNPWWPARGFAPRVAPWEWFAPPLGALGSLQLSGAALQGPRNLSPLQGWVVGGQNHKWLPGLGHCKALAELATTSVCYCLSWLRN